jgi:hypothetical protein
MRRSYPEVCDFPKQLLVVFLTRQVRVIFDNGANIGRRRFRKRDGNTKTGRTAGGSYRQRIIIGLLLFLLCNRFVEGYVARSENPRVSRFRGV